MIFFQTEGDGYENRLALTRDQFCDALVLILNKGRKEEVIIIFTAPKRSFGQGNIFSSVCEEFCSHRGSALVHPWEQTPPPEPGTPQGPDTPRSRHPPAQCMLGDTVNKQAVCILLECNLV